MVIFDIARKHGSIFAKTLKRTSSKTITMLNFQSAREMKENRKSDCLQIKTQKVTQRTDNEALRIA